MAQRSGLLLSDAMLDLPIFRPITKIRLKRSQVRGPVLSMASQATGLLQLAVLLWRYGPTNATDAYLYLFNLGILPIQVLLVGVLYPMLLNADRITRASARRLGLGVPFVTVISVGGGCVWLWIQGRTSLEVLPILILAAVNGVVQARLWYLAIAAEAEGNPRWMAAVALPANGLATLVMLLPWPTSTATVTAMMTALVVANATYLGIMVRRKVGQAVLIQLPTKPARRHSAHWWFLTKSSVGYGGLMVIQSAALVLPPATLTLLTLPTKIVGSVTATFVNAVMPLLVHQKTESTGGAKSFLRLLTLILGSVGALGVLIVATLLPEFLTQALIVALWLVASASSSVGQRLMFRFLPPSASRITLFVMPTVVLAVALSAQTPGFGLIALLCAYAMVDAATSFLILLSLREKVMTPVSGFVTGAIVGIWITSLT